VKHFKSLRENLQLSKKITAKFHYYSNAHIKDTCPGKSQA